MITVRYVDEDDLSGHLDRFNVLAAMVKWSDEQGPISRDAIKHESPIRTGRLAQSIRYSRTTDGDGVSMKFTTSVPYAKYVVGGAGPHIIRPRAAKALHWTSGGRGHFASIVHHPGNKANKFPEKALKPRVELLKQSLVDSLKEAFRA